MRNGEDTSFWRPIPGYEEYFTISSGGDIRTFNKVVKSTKGLVLYRGGFQQRAEIVDLDKEARGIDLLHGKELINNRHTAELVLLSFRGPRLSEEFKIKFRDGDRKNFNLSNLVWTIPKEKLSSCAKDALVLEIVHTEWVLELLGPEWDSVPPEPKPIEEWISRYLARFPNWVEEPEPVEWPEPPTKWEELYLSLIDRYDTDIEDQNSIILKLRSHVQRLRSQLQEFYAEMEQLENELSYRIDLLEDGLRYQLQQLEDDFDFHLNYVDAGLRYQIKKLEGELVTLKYPPKRTRLKLTDAGVASLSKTRLKLTDNAAKSLSKIPRERLTDGILRNEPA